MRDLFFSKTGIVLIGFIAVAGYFLWVEHTAHIITYLPLILLRSDASVHASWSWRPWFRR